MASCPMLPSAEHDKARRCPAGASPIPLYRHCDVLPTPLFNALLQCHHQPNTEQQSYWIPLAHTAAPTSPTASPASSPSSPPSSPPTQLNPAAPTPHATLSPTYPPPLLIEQAVHRLWHTVLRPALPAAERSPVGLEWWLHTRPVSASMFLHFDRDEWRWLHKKQAVFPLLSSITFLTSRGGPAFIVQQTTDSAMSRLYPERATVKCEGVDGAECAPLHGSLVWPMENSTVVFPGSFLHGVVGVEHDDKTDVVSMKDVVSIKDEHKDGSNDCADELPRVTLMINVWQQPLQDPTCVTLREATSGYLQQRYGKVLSEAQMGLSEPVAAPRRVELGEVSPDVMDELYRFDLQSYVNDELPSCADLNDDMGVCCASQLMCKSSLDSPPVSPNPSSPLPRPPTALRPAFILVPHLGVHIVPADQPLPTASSACHLSPLDVQLRFSMTPDQLRERAAQLGCPLQFTCASGCAKRDVFGTARSMLVQYDSHGVVDSIQFAHPAHVSLVNSLDHQPGRLLDNLLSLSVQSFYSSVKQLVDACHCQLRPPQLTVLLTGEMAVSAWSFFARDELLGDETAVGHGVAVVGITNTQQRRAMLPRPPVPKFGASESHKQRGGAGTDAAKKAGKPLPKRKGETGASEEVKKERMPVKDVAVSSGGAAGAQAKESLCPIRFLLAAACEVSNKWRKRDSDSHT